MTHRISRGTLAAGIALAALAAAPVANATPPGQTKTPPGQTKTPPGQAKKSATSTATTPPAGASSAPTASSCTAPELSQPFRSVHDSRWYMLPSGERPDSFNGNGWTLSGGAKILTARLADGRTGSVLDLPAGAQAISPQICVTSAYPSARTMLAGGGAVSFYMALAGARTWNAPQSSGRRAAKHGAWTLSSLINLHPPHVSGWHLMRIKLVSARTGSGTQLYDLYVDPRMKW